MSRPAVISLSLVESIDTYGDWFADAAKDGVIDADELTQGNRLWKPIPRKASRFHESVQGAIRALTGDGIYGPWFGRRVKEDLRNRPRLVVVNDDPEPDGPVAAKKRAA